MYITNTYVLLSTVATSFLLPEDYYRPWSPVWAPKVDPAKPVAAHL